MIRQRGQRWQVVVQDRRDPITGRRRQRGGTAATEAEARLLEVRLKEEVTAGVDGNITLACLVEEWWASAPRLAPTTELSYRQNLARHVLPTLGHHRVRDLRPRLLGTYLAHLSSNGLSAGSRRKVRTVLSSVLSYAVAMEYLDSNPMAKVPPPYGDRGVRVAPTMEEAAAILVAAELHDPEFLTFLWVATEAGVRRGEALGLRWLSVDFERLELRIDGSVTNGPDGVHLRPRTKTGRARGVAISTYTAERLRRHRAQVEERLSLAAREPAFVSPADLVFSGSTGRGRNPLDGLPWRPDSTTRRFARLKVLSRVRPEIDLHGLRHTMVTELLAAGVDPRTVMGRAGHATEAMTMQVYAKVRPASDRAAAEMWGAALQGQIDNLRNAGAAEPGTGRK